MCIALIGGMDRLEKHYMEAAELAGVDLRIFTKSEAKIYSKIKNVDAIVIFTNKVSHRIKAEAMKVAKSQGISVFMHHSCGVCTLRSCLDCVLTKSNNRGATNV